MTDTNTETETVFKVAEVLSVEGFKLQVVQQENGYRLQVNDRSYFDRLAPGELTNLLIVGQVYWIATLPPGFPSTHPMYYWDYEKGWAYLTSKGKTLLAAHQQEMERLRAEVYQPRVERWAQRAVEELLA